MVSDKHISNWLQHVAHVLPSYHLRKLGVDIASNHHINLISFAIILLYALGSILAVYCIVILKGRNKI